MKRLLCILLVLLLPVTGHAGYVSGVDDPYAGGKLDVSPEIQEALDNAILTYYQHPTPEKVNQVMDIIANSNTLDRKTASPPIVGFLTVVFADNKNRVLSWISRNDYYPSAQYVIVNALLHAKLKESALLFAKAHHWNREDIYLLRESDDRVDFKRMKIIVPGHIDSLWGAFFASGDPVYVDQIIEATMSDAIPEHSEVEYSLEDKEGTLNENKTLAARTLKDYARDHQPVRVAIERRIRTELPGSEARRFFEALLSDKEK